MAPASAVDSISIIDRSATARGGTEVNVMALRPSLQFYPRDWRGNSNLRRCTFAERGIWLEVMCLMHDSDEYGVLRWPLADIAQAIGCRPADLRALREKGVIKGADTGERCPAYVHQGHHARQPLPPVTLIPEQVGPVWFSSRMVLDEHLRLRRGADTRFSEERQPSRSLGDSPDHSPTRRQGERQGAAPTQRQGDGSSSSSSSAVQTKPPVVPLEGDGLFARFWDEWPKNDRKQARGKCFALWKSKGLDQKTEEILKHVGSLKNSRDWKEGYIPAPLVYLRQERFDGAEPVDPATPTSPASSEGLCHCGDLGVVRANNGEWLCHRHREAA